MPVDYKQGKIYVIRSHKTDKVYVGSTTQLLCKRLNNHLAKYKLYLKKKTYFITSFEIIKYNDAYIELICNCPCNNKEELCRKEGGYIRKLNSVNKHIAGRNLKEYYIDNHVKLLAQNKIYYNNNKERLLNKKKIKFNCPCGGKYTYVNKSSHMKTKKHKCFSMENNTS